MLCFLMHKIIFPAQNKVEEEKMKEIYMLAGIGVGMIAGVMLYKYCDGAKKFVDSTEKELMKKADKFEKDAETKIENAEKKVEQIKEKAKKRFNKKESK